jgi:hypothetical protein
VLGALGVQGLPFRAPEDDPQCVLGLEVENRVISLLYGYTRKRAAEVIKLLRKATDAGGMGDQRWTALYTRTARP